MDAAKHASPKRLYPVPALLLALALLTPAVNAGHPERAHYSYNNDRVFWFVLFADSHIGEDFDGGTQGVDNLTWVTGPGFDSIRPEFIIAAGDLIDATLGGLIPSTQHQEEWLAYQNLITQNGMDANIYHDVPGNHDAYGDQDFYYYKTYSVSGQIDQATQHSWNVNKPFGDYHFLSIATPGNDGLQWPFDNSGLDESELRYIDQDLLAHRDDELSFVFGHHPYSNIFYGLDPFVSMLNTYRVSLYGYGHTHEYSCDVPYETPWTVNLNTASLGKSASDQFQIVAVDNDLVVSGSYNVNDYPYVLITAPCSYEGTSNEEYRYKIPRNNISNPIRALVFDETPESVSTVRFTFDDGNYTNMQKVGDGPVWEGFFDGTQYDYGIHSLRVRASGSTTKSWIVQIKLEDTECSDGIDNDGDNLVDLADPGCQDAFDNDEHSYSTPPTIKLRLNGTRFTAGDEFLLTTELTNAGDAFTADEYIVLDFGGGYWSYPSWQDGVTSVPLILDAGSGWSEVLFDFTWPQHAGAAEHVRFWAALVEPASSQLIGSYEMVEWGFE